MTLLGKWRIVKMPDSVENAPDMLEPAYTLFEANGSGEFAFSCVTGQIFAGGNEANFIARPWTSSTAC